MAHLWQVLELGIWIEKLAVKTMSGWILASGGNEFSSSYQQADLAALEKRTDKSSALLVVVTAPFPTQELAYKTAQKHFNSLGIKTLMSPILSDKDLTTENISQLENSSAIYFAGGTPSRLVEAFIDTDAEAAIQNALLNGAVLMGSSAGAMLFGSRVVMPGGKDIGRGLNILKNQIILAHFNKPWPSWVKQFTEQDFEILGLSEGSSLLTTVTSATDTVTFGNISFLPPK